MDYKIFAWVHNNFLSQGGEWDGDLSPPPTVQHFWFIDVKL